jgi:hypothetical protein
MELKESQVFENLDKFPPKAGGKSKLNSKMIIAISNLVLLFAVVGMTGVNQILLNRVNKESGIKNNWYQKFFSLQNKTVGAVGSNGNLEFTGDPTGDAIKLAISSGVPEFYGQELGVTFDQVQASMDIMAEYDPTYGNKKVTLAGDDLKRYIDIGLKISCEYCCGAKSIVFQNGEAACGCAHSQAMRGLAAYLIQNHGSEYSNDEILKELARWKGMFFPKQMIQKLTEQRQSGQYSPDIAALLLGINLPPISGGASGNVPLPSNIENLPGMVGGC